MSRISGGTPGGNQKDAQFRAAAESRNISKAANTPALKNDVGRSAIGGISRDRSAGLVDTSKIRGAIQGVKDLGIAGVPGVSRVGTPKATMTTQQMKNLYSQYQQPPSPPPTKRQIAERLREVYPDRWGKYSISEVENAVDKLAQALPGEADINKYSAASMRNLAQVGINQVVRNITPEGMLKAIDTTGLDIKRGTQPLAFPGPSSMGMTGNWADQNLARQSYETALRSIESAVENKGVSPQARYATNFVAAGTPMVDRVRSVGSPVYGTQFGVDPAGKAAVERRNRLADIKRDYAQYRSPPSGVTIVPAAATPERAAVPGLIQYPRLDRLTPPTAAQEAARLRGLMESYQQPPGYGKEIVDRIAPEYRPYDIRIPPKDQRVITKPELSPRSAEEVSPLLKSFSERVPQEGTLEEGRLMGDLIAQDIFRKNNLAEIEAQSPSYGRLGAVDERMLYNPSEATTERMRQVFDRSRGMILPQSEYAGYGNFAPPQITAGLSRNPFDTQTAGGYSGYESFTPPVRTANLDRNVYDVGRVPSTYSGITGFSVPDRTADIARNQFDTLISPPRYSGYGEFTVPAQERNLESQFVGAEVPYRPYDISLPETTRGVQESYRWMVNPTAYTNVDGINRLGITPEERVAMDALYEEQMGEKAPGAESDTKTSPHPFQGMDEKQEANVDKTLDIVKKAQQVGGPIAGIATGVPVGLIARPLTKKYMENVKERLNKYAAMTDDEKRVAEKKDPSLIGWGRIAGIPSVGKYEDYLAWADRSGLRAPPERRGEGGGNVSAGIASLGGAMAEGGGPSAPEEPSTPSGRRPDIYYMWDLGVNIPSPSDPNYTQYQAYLAERLAAQQAMGYV